MDDVAIPRRKPPWPIIAAVGAVIGVALAVYFFPRSPDKPKITTQPVDRGDITVRVTATGALSALVTVQVGSQVSARISEINVDFNSPVKKGQVIARLDRQLLEAAVTEAKANNAAAAAAIERARVRSEDAARQRDRARELAKKALIAPADLDAAELAAKVAEADVGTAQAQLEQARSSLERATINLGYATIVSPIDGVVISRNIDVGQTVAASLQAPTLFTIAQDLSKMQVDTSVGEADIGKITAGMPATFTVDAWPGEKFHGTVRQIRNAPQTIQNVVSYDVIVDVDNSDGKLRPGMTANATFVVETKGDVLRVPNAALRFRPPRSFTAKTAGGADGGPAAPEEKRRHGVGGGGGAGTGGDEKHAGADGKKPDNAREVWVMRAGQPASTKIHTGLSDGTLTEVVDGDLKEGDEVVTDAVDPSAPAGGEGGNRGGGGNSSSGLPRRMF
jgi:HlyD family secretion protein